MHALKSLFCWLSKAEEPTQRTWNETRYQLVFKSKVIVCYLFRFRVKFKYSKKVTKIWHTLPFFLDGTCYIYCQKNWEISINFCGLPRKLCQFLYLIQVNDCQKLLFLHQLTHNMTTDCSLNHQFSTWKFQVQNMLGIFMYWIGDSMNNLLSYCGLVELRIRASEKDLPVHMFGFWCQKHRPVAPYFCNKIQAYLSMYIQWEPSMMLQNPLGWIGLTDLPNPLPPW